MKRKLKRNNQSVLVVDRIKNENGMHFCLTTLSGKDIINKTSDCGGEGPWDKKEGDHSDCSHCSCGMFHQSELI